MNHLQMKKRHSTVPWCFILHAHVAFNSTSRYLDDLLNIDNIYFDQMVDRIYPIELQLNRANSSDTEVPF